MCLILGNSALLFNDGIAFDDIERYAHRSGMMLVVLRAPFAPGDTGRNT